MYKDRYLAGKVEGTVEAQTVELTDHIRRLLIYPKVDSMVSLNQSTTEIFLPADSWTPIDVTSNRFVIRAIDTPGDIHWQGWFI